MADQLQIPPGHVCITTYGPIRHETASAVWEMRAFSEKNGLGNVRWYTLPANLVEKARNEAVREALRDAQCGWLLFVDGDMIPAPDSLLKVLAIAYGSHQHVDVVGGYCCLRGDLALPTIDSGTGTWESWFPGSGVVEVMRTGAAFLLTKRRVFEGLKDPWFRLRVPARPVDFMAEVDNWARQKFDGANPFQGQPGREWERLMQCALDDPSAADQFTPAEVGEDSGFCDRAKAAGFRIVVDTNTPIGHVETRVTDWRTHKTAVAEMERNARLVAGWLD